MRSEQRQTGDKTYNVIVADEGKTFIRKNDNFDMGKEVILGIDYSTGKEREDKEEYYDEVIDFI